VIDHADFWRISFDGRASLLRIFHEDRFEKTPRDLAEGQKWFDPWLHARDITEVVRHARAYAGEFSDVTEICFQLEWMGLKSRFVATISDRYYSESYTSHTNWRNVFDCVPQAEIIGNLPGVVARLFAPVYRMSNPRSEITDDYVAQAIKKFVVQGL